MAAAPGSLIQICQNCGRALRDQADNSREQREYWYPAHVLVGFDCAHLFPGQVDANVAAAAEVEAGAEPARTLPKRGSKKTTEPQPEQEHAIQTAAGKKAAKPLMTKKSFGKKK